MASSVPRALPVGRTPASGLIFHSGNLPVALLLPGKLNQLPKIMSTTGWTGMQTVNKEKEKERDYRKRTAYFDLFKHFIIN